jgi:hypothetical protein
MCVPADPCYRPRRVSFSEQIVVHSYRSHSKRYVHTLASRTLAEERYLGKGWNSLSKPERPKHEQSLVATEIEVDWSEVVSSMMDLAWMMGPTLVAPLLVFSLLSGALV